jgi:tetratricopeptide (TPR) repeat protein
MLLTDQLQRAVHHHQLGEFALAECLYQEILANHPKQFDALHLLGVLAKQAGNPQKAIFYIEQALQVDALQPSAHCIANSNKISRPDRRPIRQRLPQDD